jgi:hypothetical protein
MLPVVYANDDSFRVRDYRFGADDDRFRMRNYRFGSDDDRFRVRHYGFGADNESSGVRRNNLRIQNSFQLSDHHERVKCRGLK